MTIKLQSAFLVSCIAILSATMSCRAGSSASGAYGTRLSLAEPSDQRIAQGESARMAIHIDRRGFADPVRITFGNLPAGVQVEGDTILAGEESREFVLIASPGAPIVDRQIVTVTARGSAISTSQTFEISVKSRS